MNVLVTCANRGLGLCLVKVFADQGHYVLAGLYSSEDASSLIAYAIEHKDNVRVVALDVSDEVSVSNAAKLARCRYAHLDVVIHHAGVLLPGAGSGNILEMDIKEFRRIMEVNTTGSLLAMKYLFPLMREDGGSTMLFIVSGTNGVNGTETEFPAYSISKAAVNKAVYIFHATVGDQCRAYVLYLGPTMEETALGEAANAIYGIAVGETVVQDNGLGLINLRGEAIEI